MSNETSIDLKQCVLDAVLSGLIALVVFGPIVGVVLDGYGFNLHYERVGWIIAIVMAGRFLLSLYLQTRGGRAVLERFEGAGSGVHVLPPGYKTRLRWIVPLILVAAVIFPFFASKYLLAVVILGLIYVLLGLGLNIVVGLAELLDLGYVAFYAIGAYGLALGYQYLGLGFWTVLPLAALTAAVAGAILGFPVLRMHGDYLAIVTLGFGEIIRLVLNNWLSFTGGPNGMPAPAPTFLGLEFGRRAKDGGVPIHEFLGIAYNPNMKFLFIYVVLFLVVLLVLYIKHRLTRMPVGRAWEALREDEIACRAMGLNHVLVKLSAFMLGASTAGLAGVFFASYQGFVNPSSFNFFESALILAIVVLGGMGSTVGVVIAAFVLTVAPELLRSFADIRVLLLGILMVVMMIWRPRGLIRISRVGFAPRKGGAMSDKILSVEHLMMHFGGIKALNDVNLDVERGSITALIGPNGAGKTTVFNCLTGFYKATGGNILLNTQGRTTDVIQVLGEPFQLDDFVKPPQLGSRLYYKMFGGTHLVNRAGLARTFQNIRLFKDMSVVENLLVAQHMFVNRNLLAGILNTPGYRRAESEALDHAFYWLEVVDLVDCANRLAGEMSYGQQRRLEIARAMCTRPELICLDEPAAGLNPAETHALSNIVRYLRDHHGITVLLIEHDMGMVMNISDHIIVLDHGDVIARGNPEQIRHDEKVIAAYLGADEEELS